MIQEGLMLPGAVPGFNQGNPILALVLLLNHHSIGIAGRNGRRMSETKWVAIRDRRCRAQSQALEKRLADRALAQVSDDKLHVPLDGNTHPIAVIMKHVAGNLASRETDFLTSDGEKPDRNRDDEFVESFHSRTEVLDAWERVAGQSDDDAESTHQCRLREDRLDPGEAHTVPLALERSLAHTCFHVGQIVEVARVHAGEIWNTLTIRRGGSDQFNLENWGRPGSRTRKLDN
jgi:hypothetical protein